MKKVLCLTLCLMMIMSSVSTMAATKELGAYSDSDVYATNVYIEGKADFGGQAATILLKNGDRVGYINEIMTDTDGSYKLKFKFDGDLAGYSIKVRDSGTSEDITHTLTTAFAKKDVYSLDIDLNVSNNDVMYYISESDYLNIIADIDNKYGDNAKVSVMIAAYDENNKLLLVKTKSLDIGYDDLNTVKNVDFSDIQLPEGTVKAKAFAWQDTVDLMPLTEEEVKKSFDGNLTFVNKNADPNDNWVVGLAGASTVHAGEYAAFLYQYYATRYPGKNIVILNKGAGGCTARDIYNRLEWDIFNEKDPMGYGACDEIAIMVGANDSNYWQYTHGKMEDDEYESYYDGTDGRVDMTAVIDASFENYKKIVEWCKAKGKGVTFTPMTIYDESDAFESTLSYDVVYGANHAFGMLSDRLEKYAEEEGIPFIDTWGMSNEYTTRIREQYPNATTVITGTDGLHHSSNGGYLVGYIIARGQETDEVVAAVDIDARTSSFTTDGATVSDLIATPTGISYTYLADALPMYAKAPGYEFAEGYGVDITNTMNKEIIKVTGLEDGNYTIKFIDQDDKEYILGTYKSEELAAGVNIATLENNPGQIQSKGLYDNYYNQRKTAENNLRHIFNEELRLRNKNSNETLTVKGAKVINEMYMPHDDKRYENFTTQDWINLCDYFDNLGTPTDNASNYSTIKNNQDNYIAEVKACIEGMKDDCIPKEHTVEITKE